jgi:Relaxase/Mobilisation nuclease domain
MIQKISKPGSGFRGALNYVLAARKQPELIGGNMAGETARELAKEFGQGRALNQAVHKPVFHASLTAAPEDRLSEDDWRRFAATYLERLGYGDCQWALIRHRDTANDHVHIVASRIDSRGKRVRDRKERQRGEAIVRDLERELGLRQVAPSRQASHAAPGRGELAAFARTGQVAAKARLQEHVDLAARGAPSLAELAERLAQQGVRVRAHVASTDRLSGLSFELDGVSCKGSDLGRGYSWRGLAARTGVTYEPARDLPGLRALGAVPAPPAPPAPPRPLAPRGVDAPGSSLPGIGQRLRDEIDRAAREGPTLPDFVDRLGAAGVRVRVNLASTGRLSGLSFELEGVRLRGSELGRDYAWRALAGRHGISFEPERDRSRLERSGATVRQREAVEPLPEVPPRVPVYRAAATLASRVEVGARVRALEERLDEQASIAREAGQRLAERAQEERLATVAPAALDRGLRTVYDEPEAAGRKLEDLMAREGTLRAAEVLERSPERLGELRGVGLGGLRSAARREAIAGAGEIGRELRAAAARQARLGEGEPAAAAAAARAKTAKGKVRRLSRSLGQLPPWRRLEADMVRAAGVLGEQLTARLAPATMAGKLVRRALRAALELARGRDDDRSLGR